jgi:glycosyltransferase involved in cell wall biosynthesis
MRSVAGTSTDLVRRTCRGLLESTFRRACSSRDFDVYHEPNVIPVDSPLPTITTIHDLSVLLHPEWHPKSRIRWYEQGLPASLRQTAHFIAISEFTRRQIIEHLGVAPDKVTSIHLAARPEFRPLPTEVVTQTLRKLGLPSRYLLYVGTVEPRKNLLRLMQAYVALPDAVRNACPLLIVGQWGWNVTEERDYYERVASHRGVRLVGYLPDADLPAVFNGARALVYPSVYEGFGLPPLEMMACGGAVLGARIDPIVEVVGDQGDLIAPDDIDGWRSALHRVITDDDWRGRLRHGAIEAANRFSWQRSAQETVDVYRKTLQGSAPVRHPGAHAA